MTDKSPQDKITATLSRDAWVAILSVFSTKAEARGAKQAAFVADLSVELSKIAQGPADGDDTARGVEAGPPDPPGGF